MNTTPQKLFRVICKDKEYVIYTDGRTEGFEDESTVVNYYPALLAASKLGAVHQP